MADSTDAVFQTLRELVQSDPVLQARLFDLADTRDFIAAVLQLAQSLGCDLTEGDVRQALHSGRKAWTERRQP